MQRGLLSGERVICGSKGLLMSNCARVWCCNVKSHMKTIHLDIDKTCFQCSSVSESWKSCSLKCVFRWCLFIAETSSSRRGAKTILTDHDSCTRLLIPLLSVRFLEVMVCQCWRKHSVDLVTVPYYGEEQSFSRSLLVNMTTHSRLTLDWLKSCI